jgi:hypothetical protein
VISSMGVPGRHIRLDPCRSHRGCMAPEVDADVSKRLVGPVQLSGLLHLCSIQGGSGEGCSIG